MLFSKLIFSTFAIAGTQAFAPTQHKSFVATNAIRDEKTQIYSYLDSLVSASPLDFSSVNPQQQDASSNPSTFGQMISGGIDDISALDAASAEIRAVVARTGSISAAEISNLLDKSNNIVSIIRHHFPGAVGSSEILNRVRNTLDNYGADNILLTQSVCPDEINHERGDITDLFIENIGGGKVFHLGGLAGVPFAGKTGFGAYSAHVGDGAHAFVLQAPHIGLSHDLTLGKYSRDGQSHAGSACGAAVGAMCHCAAGNPLPNLSGSPDDYQMNFLINEISKSMPILNQCTDDNEKQAELARQTHAIGKGMLDTILSTKFGDANSMLFVLTGIQINMPFDFEDYFQPVSFEVRKKDGSVIDLFGETF